MKFDNAEETRATKFVDGSTKLSSSMTRSCLLPTVCCYSLQHSEHDAEELGNFLIANLDDDAAAMQTNSQSPRFAVNALPLQPSFR